MPSANGLYYFLHEADDPATPPILLIHGAGGSHLHWAPDIRRLNGFKVIALDLPGHGKSEGIGRQSIADYVIAVQNFMDAMDLPAAIIVGHSMGSAIALQLALDAPDRVLGLVMVSGGSRLRVNPSILENAMDVATFPLAVKEINTWAFGPESDPRLRELAAQRMQKETRPTVLHGDFLACNDFNASERLAEIDKPTLILCGTDDKMTPFKHSQTLSQEIKGAKLVEIEGAGHMVGLEKPRAIAEALEAFVHQLNK
jgi:pimeloyl-ACP methyl ester carboxylesterase